MRAFVERERSRSGVGVQGRSGIGERRSEFTSVFLERSRSRIGERSRSGVRKRSRSIVGQHLGSLLWGGWGMRGLWGEAREVIVQVRIHPHAIGARGQLGTTPEREALCVFTPRHGRFGGVFTSTPWDGREGPVTNRARTAASRARTRSSRACTQQHTLSAKHTGSRARSRAYSHAACTQQIVHAAEHAWEQGRDSLARRSPVAPAAAHAAHRPRRGAV